MGKIFFISDSHFHHKNIIGYDKRPFNNTFEMNKHMIEKWNEVVTYKDEVYFLGDFIFGTVKQAEEIREQLNGTIHLIVGNHDKKLLKNRDFRNLFSTVNEYKELYIDNKQVILFHYPIKEWDGFFRDSVHLYGHVHIKGVEGMSENAYNVGASLIDYTPKTLKQITEKVIVNDKK